jgi:hypothetical protein
MKETDSHWIWRVVEHNRAAAEKAAPEGHQAIVEVHLVGVPAPVVVERVETRHDQPWVMLHSYGPEEERTGTHPEDRLVFVPPAHIARLEIRFVRTGRYPTGFAVSELDDETAS